MRTAEQAREIALSMLDPHLALLDSRTEEFEVGWVFCYQSARFIETGEIADSVVGNAPIFVPRNGAPATFISYHRPTSESMEAFSYCGDANAQVNPEVEISGWLPGALKVSATQAIRTSSGLGLGTAKELVDQCLSGAVVRVRAPSIENARELVSELGRLHFISKVTYGA